MIPRLTLAAKLFMALLLLIAFPYQARASGLNAIDASNTIAAALLHDMLAGDQVHVLVSPALQWLMYSESALALHTTKEDSAYVQRQYGFLRGRIGPPSFDNLAAAQRAFRDGLESDGVELHCRYWASRAIVKRAPACQDGRTDTVDPPAQDSIDAWTAKATHGAIEQGIDEGFELNQYTQSVVVFSLSYRPQTLPDLLTRSELGEPPISYVTGRYRRPAVAFQKYSQGEITGIDIDLHNGSEMFVFRAPDWQLLRNFGDGLIARLPAIRTRFVDAVGDVWISNAIQSSAYLFADSGQDVYLPAFGGRAVYGVVQRGVMQSAARSIDLTVQSTLTASDPVCCLDSRGGDAERTLSTFDAAQGNCLVYLVVDKRGLILFEAVS
jgi:hypothetical protein